MSPESAGTEIHLRRLVDFAEPRRDDRCLDIARGGRPIAPVLSPRVRHVASVDASGQGPREASGVRADPAALPYPNGCFTLVTARFSLHRLADPVASVREMLRVCGPDGRLVIADLVRTTGPSADRDRSDRPHAPARTTTPTVGALTDLLARAGADVRRLDVFTLERPIDPWLTQSRDPGAAARIRRRLTAELDGGPPTGARPRLIGGEIWFTQCWAHVAAVPYG